MTLKTKIVVLFFLIFQVLSFLVYQQPTLRGIIFWLLIAFAIGASLLKIEYGFFFLFFEFLSGHQGHLFEFAGLSIRLALFLTIMSIWLWGEISKKGIVFSSIIFRQKILMFFSILFFLIFLSFILGVIQNDSLLAIKDFINYFYLLLIFPLISVFKKDFFHKNFLNLVQGVVIGLGITTIIVFVLFSTHLVKVHDQFYWWWRGVVMGKVTDTGFGFFRIVTSAHLLILPAFLICLSFLAKYRDKRQLWFLLFLMGIMLVINFSRGYFLGLFVGLFFLKRGLSWRHWLIFSLIAVLILVAEFLIIYGLVNGGKALVGLDFLKGRMETIFSPEEELSSLTRIRILPFLLEKISQQSIFSQGLGATIYYLDPLTNQKKSTFHLDWGYLEMWLELGFFTLLFYLLLLANIFFLGWRKERVLKNVFVKRMIIGGLAGLVALMVVNLTGPVLFHSLGIFYLILISVIIINVEENKVNYSNCCLE